MATIKKRPICKLLHQVNYRLSTYSDISDTIHVTALPTAAYYHLLPICDDRLCGLVVRVSGYRYRGPGFDPRRYQIF